MILFLFSFYVFIGIVFTLRAYFMERLTIHDFAGTSYKPNPAKGRIFYSLYAGFVLPLLTFLKDTLIFLGYLLAFLTVFLMLYLLSRELGLLF